jgi:hypothetical protein
MQRWATRLGRICGSLLVGEFPSAYNSGRERQMEQPIKPCKLCLETKMLEDSHFMPQFIYKYCRTEGVEPIRVIADIALSTSRQIHDHLLCKECEDILNKGGESWMAEKLATLDGKFPLHDLVASGPVIFAEEEYRIYYGIENLEVKYDMIMHFAMGIFWKASVHSWIAGRTEPWIDLKEHSERIRLFLRGGEFPEEVALNVVLTTPERAYIGAQEPYQAAGDENRYFMFSVPGIWFNLIVGKNIPHHS